MNLNRDYVFLQDGTLSPKDVTNPESYQVRTRTFLIEPWQEPLFVA
jgi:hypothetical protein